MVALLAEGVDRNTATLAANPYVLAASPSSRRAWIEIRNCRAGRLIRKVALLAEGVDRNDDIITQVHCNCRSPSSRRAWIEILLFKLVLALVARSPSSRRAWIEIQLNYWNTYTAKSPSSRRAWIEIQ